MVGTGQQREGLLEFFDVLWGERGTNEVNDTSTRGGEGADYVCVATIDQQKNIRRNMYEWPHDSASIVTKIFKETADGLETYVIPGVFKTPASTRKDNFKKSYNLWVDFDGNAPDLWDDTKHGIPIPSMRIISSTVDRQHCYWRLDQPVFDSADLENRNRTLAYTLEADIGGWDCVQLLRAPYTTNYGYAKPDRKKAYPVTVEELIIDRKYEKNKFQIEELLVASVSHFEDKVMTAVQLLASNRWTEQLIEEWDMIPEEGSKKRSDALLSMAHQAAEIGWSSASIFALVFHMDEKIGKYKNRSDRYKRLNDIVDIVIMRHRSRKDTTVAADVNIVKRLPSLGRTEIRLTWIVEGLMPVKSLGLLVSPPGLGKTTLTMRIGMRIVAGEDKVLSRIIEQNGDSRPVLMYSLEMSELHLGKFVQDMNLSPEDDEKYKDFFVMATGRDMFLDTPEGKQLFEDTLSQIGPRLIFIDSLNKIIRKSIADDDAIRALMSYLSTIIEQFNLSIIVLHHDRKRQAGQSTTELDDVYGSRFLTSEADYVVTLARGEKKDQIKIHYPKIRFGEQPDPITIHRVGDLDFEVMEEVDATVRHNSTGKSGPDDSGDFTGSVFGDQ